MFPKFITVHASATKMDQDFDVEDVRRWHTDPKPRGRGWSDIGYHLFIKLDGTLQLGRPLYRQGAHVGGHNEDNVGICMAGGLDPSGVPAFTFTGDQIETLVRVLRVFSIAYNIPLENIKGHRDWSPDLDGNGEITADEYMKECPCFDVRELVLARLP
jgi:hypothetical protein